MKFTTEYLQQIIDNTYVAMSTQMAVIVNKERYGLPCLKEYEEFTMLFLFSWALSTWNQSSVGESESFTNCLTEDQMNQLVRQLKNLSEVICAGTDTGEVNPDDTEYLDFAQENGFYMIP